MAKFIPLKRISDQRRKMLPEDYGYTLIRMYGLRIGLESLSVEKSWIEKNIEGKWSSWNFYDGPDGAGHTFAFELEEDAFAFKLRWM